MSEWEAWRSRDIRWVKPHTNGRGEAEYRDRDGKTYPRESFVRAYERLDEDKKEATE